MNVGWIHRSSFVLHLSSFVECAPQFERNQSMAEIKKVGVLGCGLMGSGIAQVAAQAGYDTVVREVEQKFLDKGIGGIEKSLGKFVEEGELSAAGRDAALGRLAGAGGRRDPPDSDIALAGL